MRGDWELRIELNTKHAIPRTGNRHRKFSDIALTSLEFFAYTNQAI